MSSPFDTLLPGGAPELRASQEWLRLVFDKANDMMAVIEAGPGPVFRVVSVNRQYVAVVRAAGFAVTAENLVGKTLVELVAEVFKFPPATGAALLARYQEASRSPQAMHYEETVETPVGRWYGDTTLTPIRDDTGLCTFILYTSRDITDRRRSEEALRRSEELFRAIVGDQSEMIVRWKPDGTRTFVNQAYCKFFGGTPQAMVGSSFFPLIVEADREAIREKIRSLTPDHPVAVATHRSHGASGEILWQEWSDRGIFDADGRLVELQSVGRDITERKRAEIIADLHRTTLEQIASGSALPRTLESILMFVQGQLAGAIASILLVDEEGRLRHGSGPGLPTAYCEAVDGAQIGPSAGSCGTAAYLGRTVSVADIATDPLWKDYKGLALQYGLRACWSTPIFSKKRKVLGTFAIYYREPRSPAPREVNLVEDTTPLAAIAIERAQVERALQASEERFRATFAQAAVGMAHLSLDGHWLRANDKLCDITGYTREELLTHTFADLLHPEDKAAEDLQFQRLADGQVDNWLRELRFERRSGETVWVTAAMSVIRQPTGGRGYLIAAIDDISERKTAESRLHRLNRLYAVSSSINEAIIRIRDPQKLYEAACQIAVEEGLLQLAWVGLIDEETRTLKPVCSCGNDHGYTAGLNISIDDVPAGRGTGGRAVRTGTYAYSNDLEHDPLMAPWRRESLARGLRSIASFPLKIEGRVIGVIAVLAGQPNFFTTDELQLLDALAANLSFAIELAQKERERQAASAALSENQRVLSTLLGNLPGMAYRCRNDQHWTMEFVSNGCRELTGYAAEELLFNRVTSYEAITHPEDRPAVRRAIEAAVQQGRQFDLHYRIVTLSGAEKWVWERGVGIVSPTGELRWLEGFITDVSERRHAEEQVKSQAALLDKAHDAIIVRDLEDVVIYWNKSAERLYGVPAAEAHGRRISELIYRDLTGFNAARQDVMATGGWSGILNQIDRQGREIVVDSSWTLVRDDHGQPKSILVINTDITEKRKIEAQFLRAQRVENIGTLAGGIAHDLNNILTPIVMSIDMLRLKITAAEDLAMLDALHASATRGAQMIRQILAFARGAEGKRERLQPVELVWDIQRICRDTFPKSIQTQTRMPPEVPGIVGDSTQLHQVLLNLCVNARDAMPQGGTLILGLETLEITRAAQTDFPQLKPGPHVVFHVSDTGAGIPEAIKEKIFDPFFTTKPVGKGTGLGLATAQGIVKSHGGCVHVASRVGVGSTFSIYLPAEPSSPREQARLKQSSLPRGKGELILVVDDETAILSLARRTLETFGYRVVTAPNGAEAVKIYSQQPHDIALVLTDMMMPVMDGPATIQALLQINPRLPIIAASGYSSQESAAKAVAAGVKHFLPKPYTAEALLKVLQTLLRG
jgi:PAS domain S-box-containing protein